MKPAIRSVAICTAALTVATLACGGRSAPEHHAGDDAPTLSHTTGQDDPLLGRWSLVTDPPPARRLGTRLTLEIDSVAGDSAFGRLRMMFSGDVGIDPAQFAGLRGRRSDGTVTLSIPASDPDASGLAFEGVLEKDTIRLSSFRIGADEMLGEAARLLLVRET